jgi:hypothetical protein
LNSILLFSLSKSKSREFDISLILKMKKIGFYLLLFKKIVFQIYFFGYQPNFCDPYPLCETAHQNHCIP